MKLTAGGLDETSYATRLIPATSFVIRDDIFRRTSGGKTYLPKGERFRVKIAKHTWGDKSGKGERTKVPWIVNLHPFACGTDEASPIGIELTSQRS